MKKMTLFALLVIISFSFSCLSFYRENEPEREKYGKHFTRPFVYTGVLLDTGGFYFQQSMSYRGNILRALDRACDTALKNSNLFPYFRESNTPGNAGEEKNAYYLVIKTDVVSFAFNRKGLAVKIRLYVIVYNKADYQTDPLYYRAYLSTEKGGLFGNPIPAYHRALDTLMHMVLDDLAGADFDNDGYTSVIKQIKTL